MTDLRQGVTPAAHAVLDLLDAEQAAWSDAHTLASQLQEARASADVAHAGYITNRALTDIRASSIEAAARLIDAIGEIDRCIAGGER